jgi:hypothetical protein
LPSPFRPRRPHRPHRPRPDPDPPVCHPEGNLLLLFAEPAPQAPLSPRLQPALLILQGIQIAFILLHDWLPLGRLSNPAAIHSIDSRLRLASTTFLSALPFVIPFAFCCVFERAPHWPTWLHAWLWWTYVVTLAAVLYAWWGPYLLWHDAARAERYRIRFAGTIRFLPERHGFAPDTLHVGYHVCLLATVILLAMR